MQASWGEHLQQLPQLNFLAHGWLGFITANKEDANWILKDYWEIGGSPIFLQRWSPLFDGQTAVAESEPV